MMPLWTTAIEPETCGWALRSLGTPWVAQRVWAMPVTDRVLAEAASSSATRPTERTRSMPVAADDGQPGRVIAPVFELLQAFDENGNNVAAGCCRDNATHG